MRRLDFHGTQGKAVTQAVKAEVQGAWVDGELGRARP